MNDRELYRQKYQARLDEVKAEIAALKARASGAKADAQLEINTHLRELDHRMHDAGDRLAELAAAGEETWDAARKKAESTWGALKAGASAAAAKFKE
jgi:hypothetical protein